MFYEVSEVALRKRALISIDSRRLGSWFMAFCRRSTVKQLLMALSTSLSLCRVQKEKNLMEDYTDEIYFFPQAPRRM